MATTQRVTNYTVKCSHTNAAAEMSLIILDAKSPIDALCTALDRLSRQFGMLHGYMATLADVRVMSVYHPPTR